MCLFWFPCRSTLGSLLRFFSGSLKRHWRMYDAHCVVFSCADLHGHRGFVWWRCSPRIDPRNVPAPLHPDRFGNRCSCPWQWYPSCPTSRKFLVFLMHLLIGYSELIGSVIWFYDKVLFVELCKLYDRKFLHFVLGWSLFPWGLHYRRNPRARKGWHSCRLQRVCWSRQTEERRSRPAQEVNTWLPSVQLACSSQPQSPTGFYLGCLSSLFYDFCCATLSSCIHHTCVCQLQWNKCY